ncbi:MAG: hypothetical protein C7B45_04735 [Sulfobacillus acidophilus]|uniref:Thiolase C-terminal domain-containing protein n=1 Tax=Sulfobacillus acidophilus TaxID=53633 RepID=A0A2T2WL31_9FIRM|nr:MAG: hypothetical protein C7B45_04735 [Sulfobacillus acidophilus]
MIFETAQAALQDAGIGRDDIDNVVLAASDELDGRSISSMLTAMPAGALLKDEVKVTDSGLHGLILGTLRILSGLYDIGMVVSWSKVSECRPSQVWRGALEPFFSRDVGAIDPLLSAAHAARYVADYGIDVSLLDAVANRMRNRPGTPDFDAAPTYLAYPLKASHFAPTVDGVAAVVIASSQAFAQRRFAHQPMWIRGMGWDTDAYYLGQRGWDGWKSLRIASRLALERAGISLSSVDVVGLEDISSFELIMGVEAIGLADQGHGAEWILDSGYSINSLANGFGGYPPFCAGLWRISRITQAMRSSGAQHALVQGRTGQGAQGHAVVVLSQKSEGGM